MKISFLVTLIVIQVSYTQPNPPIFPDQYELAFNESSSIGPYAGKTAGKLYLDAKANQ